MKASLYNIFVKCESQEKYAVYNSRTNALALMDYKQYEQYNDLVNCGAAISDEGYFQDLVRGGFIVEDNESEVETLRLNLLKSRFQTNSLSLTIAPTSDCNFRCVYCYEKDSKRFPPMSEDVQNCLVDFVNNQSKTISHLQVTWYGGEPLLCLDIIRKLTRQFIEMCSKNNIQYGAGIITNGYLLTPEVCKEFQELYINTVQVTLDGTAEHHDVRRPLKNGGGSFNKIISNLQKLKDILPFKISLRVNIDKNNLDDAQNIGKLLKDYGIDEVVNPYLAMVRPINNCCPAADCFTSDTFAEIYYQFEGQKIDWDYIQVYPRLKFNFCGADSINSFVIDSDGLMYKCWNDIGIHERSVGHLKKLTGTKVSKSLNILKEYLLYDPTLDEECMKCKILPICMGGCPSDRLQRTDRCALFKTYIKTYINAILNDTKVSSKK